ncbi:3-oxo-5-alpha-steroid 4-dehydrogenase-domain-containing protein [Geopyxis carbonaria]|nr:3-oxo-5-alpha-steroid 4-dehydrogenase-domain-containing protein [Geopyxis carbonaria]
MAPKMINLQVKPRGRPIKNLPPSIEFDLETTTTDALYAQLSSKCGMEKHRFRITKGSDGSYVSIKGTDGKPMLVEDVGLRDGSQIFVKDLGPQIAWRTVFIIEYLGPLIMHPLFISVLRPYIYSTSALNPLSYLPVSPSKGDVLYPPTQAQTVLCALITLHFLKREYETLFVHRFSSATMPFTNLFKNSGHYWVFSGINLAYFLYLPAMTSSSAFWWPKALDPETNPVVMWGAVALWVFAQVSNYKTHVTLRNLRPADGSTQRMIPRGYGFNLVTCPNYLFEALAWVAILIISGGNWAAALFLAVSGGQMMLWAKKKERRYRKEFGRQYKKKRSMIPGIW